jgi:hypothetical protein
MAVALPGTASGRLESRRRAGVASRVGCRPVCAVPDARMQLPRRATALATTAHNRAKTPFVEITGIAIINRLPPRRRPQPRGTARIDLLLDPLREECRSSGNYTCIIHIIYRCQGAFPLPTPRASSVAVASPWSERTSCERGAGS